MYIRKYTSREPRITKILRNFVWLCSFNCEQRNRRKNAKTFLRRQKDFCIQENILFLPEFETLQEFNINFRFNKQINSLF